MAEATATEAIPSPFAPPPQEIASRETVSPKDPIKLAQERGAQRIQQVVEVVQVLAAPDVLIQESRKVIAEAVAQTNTEAEQVIKGKIEQFGNDVGEKAETLVGRVGGAFGRLQARWRETKARATERAREAAATANEIATGVANEIERARAEVREKVEKGALKAREAVETTGIAVGAAVGGAVTATLVPAYAAEGLLGDVKHGLPATLQERRAARTQRKKEEMAAQIQWLQESIRSADKRRAELLTDAKERRAYRAGNYRRTLQAVTAAATIIAQPATRVA